MSTWTCAVVKGTTRRDLRAHARIWHKMEDGASRDGMVGCWGQFRSFSHEHTSCRRRSDTLRAGRQHGSGTLPPHPVRSQRRQPPAGRAVQRRHGRGRLQRGGGRREELRAGDGLRLYPLDGVVAVLERAEEEADGDHHERDHLGAHRADRRVATDAKAAQQDEGDRQVEQLRERCLRRVHDARLVEEAVRDRREVEADDRQALRDARERNVLVGHTASAEVPQLHFQARRHAVHADERRAER
mmetsp:Transcript_15232/g.40196  ORF Transcript_15232/g.40196 Transcript_15232/m.40196 type:complete len:243 (+) Transcript_15232:16-744(+)